MSRTSAAAKKKPHLTPAQIERPVLGVRVPRPTAQKIRDRARETGRPVSDLIEELIERSEREDERIRKERPDLTPLERLSHNLYNGHVAAGRKDMQKQP